MTFTIKRRGTPGPIAAEYLCPEHGRFDLVVARDELGDPPVSVICQRDLGVRSDAFAPAGQLARCDRLAEHVISAPRVKKMFKPTAAVKGKADDRPSPLHMDHAAVADGKITMGEWQEQRDATWRDWRHDQVKKAVG